MSVSQRRHDSEYDHLLPLFRHLADPLVSGRDRDQTRQALLTGHLPLAEHIALRYCDRGQPLDDLRQVARMGLIYAVDRFDPARGDFVAFAVPTIMGEVRRYFRDFSWTIRVPRGLKELNRKIATAVSELSIANDAAPRPAQIAAHLGLPVENVYQGLRAGMAYHPDSLDIPSPRDDGPNAGLAEFGRADHGFERVENRETLDDAMTRLPRREAEIVRLRFFDELTQGQIGLRMGLSQVHVSRLLARSLTTLRHSFFDEPSNSGTLVANNCA